MKRRIAISTLMILGACAAAFGQGDRHNDYRADQTLRSNARVNPSTLAMELSIPLAGLPGRAANSMPVGISYSSKVWELKTLTAPTNPEIAVRVLPRFSSQSAAGWTSTLNIPRIDYDQYEREMYYVPANGDPQPYILGESPDNVVLFYVKRVRVVMPGGSSVEFRKDDAVYARGGGSPSPTAADRTGTFLSVDGSRMRLEMGATTTILYLPDGGRYIFAGAASTPTSFIDRHGNTTTLAETQTVDTLGRTITNPVPLSLGTNQLPQTARTAGTNTYYYPGIGSSTRAYNLVWAELTNVLDAGQSLRPAGDRNCSASPPTFVADALFQSLGFMACYGSASLLNPVVLSRVELPDGSSYTFKYNSYGEITRIDYPTGGYERFEYQQIQPVGSELSPYNKSNRGVKFRWVSEGGTGAVEMMSKYEVETGTLESPKYLVRITAPDLSYTEQFLYSESNSGSVYGFTYTFNGRAYDERSYSTTGVLMGRKLTKWTETGSLTINGVAGYPGVTRDLRPEKEVSIIFESGNSNALATMSETVYDTAGSSDPTYFSPLNPKQTKSHNFLVVSSSTASGTTLTPDNAIAWFSSSTAARVSEMDYLYDANYKARNITGLVTETRVKDAAGNIKARSQIGYDESAYPIISAGTNAQWQDPNTTLRANVTTTRSWSDITNNLFVETHAQYDNFGNLRKAWDAKGNVSETEYSSVYQYAYPTLVRTPIPDPTGVNGSNTAFTTTSVYDFNTGLPTSVTDANGQTSMAEYNDPLLRPTKTIAPNGQQTITEYGAGTTASTRWVKVSSQIDATNWKQAYSWFDGLGRTIKAQSVETTGDVFVDTEYDIMGRAKRSTNPYRNGEIKQWTTPTYDNIGRMAAVTAPDSSVVNFAYGLSTSGLIGVTKTVTDQAGKKRKGISDALGRTIRVIEDPDTQNLATDYVFDTLGNLRKTTQGEQNRYFMHDSLGRLLYAKQVEQDANTNFSGTNFTDPVTSNNQWSVKYVYDDNGNISSTTDARNKTITATYDSLNRLTLRDYSDATMPDVSFYYDGKYVDANDAAQTASGGVKGKTTGIKSSVSRTNSTAFDATGRLLTSQQITDGQAYNFGYIYNLSGALMEETYPSGRVVKNTLNADGELSQVQSKKNPSSGFFTYARGFTYNSAGAVTKMQIGNGRWETAQYNERLQVTQIGLGNTDTTQDILKLQFGYGTTDNNGSMKSQTITVPTVGGNAGFIAVQSYTYDSLNRIHDATETVSSTQTWKQTFVYDRYGNRRFDAANTTTIQSGCPTAVCNPTIDTSNNKFTSGQNYSYDADGSVTQDATGQRFGYDAENRQNAFFAASNSGSTPDATYSFDGEGKRVKKISATETTVFVYDATGRLSAEYSTAVASPADAKVAYLTADHLGSPRVITDANGSVISRKDFAAFGDETITSQRTTGLGYNPPNVRQDYTGYEKDSESGLEYAQARYYNPAHGRYTSVDPLTASATIKNPQTFNRYSYVLNSPYKFTDPLGLLPQSRGFGGGSGFCGAEFASCGGGPSKAPGEAEYEDRLRNTYDVIDANRAIANGNQAAAEAICAGNSGIECNRANSGTVTVTASVNSYFDPEDVGIKIIFWDPVPGTTRLFGHVSFVIDGFSYSFDAEGYHRDDPATFFKEESKAGGGTAYILNFGRRTLNDAFKVAIERGYSSNEIYTGLTNRSTACGSAMNTISSALNLRYDFAMTPKGQENYIKANLQRYIVGDPIRIPMSGPKEASGGGIIPTRDRPCGYRKDC